MSASEKHSDDQRPVWFVALAHTLTGVVFAVLLSMSFIFAPEIPYIGNPLKVLNRLGVSLGMGIYADEYAERRRAMPDGRLEPRFVFVDITRDTCEAYYGEAGSRRLCRTGSPTRPEILYHTLKALRAGPEQPAVVIVDAALTDRRTAPDWPGPETARLAAAGAPIIHPGASRRADRARTVWFDGRDDPSLRRILPERPDLAERMSRAALVRTFVEPQDDGLVRRYPPAVLARPVEDGPPFLVPSAPFAAAVVVRKGWDGFVALADSMARGGDAACGSGHEGEYGFDDALLCLDALAGGRAIPAPPEILFTLRSLSASREAPPLVPSYPEDARQAAYVRIRTVADPSDPSMESSIGQYRPWLKDAVVVLGSSDVGVDDVHETPIGPMAGAEVILNVTRSFLTFSHARHLTILHKIEHKSWLISISSVVFFFCWIVIVRSLRKLETRGRAARLVTHLWIACVYALGFLLSVAGTLAFEAYVSAPRVATGDLPPDLLTPIVAFLLEGFAEGAKWLLDRLHHLVERGVTWICDLPRRKRPLSSSGPAVAGAGPITSELDEKVP